jgi:hypothetical protein
MYIGFIIQEGGIDFFCIDFFLIELIFEKSMIQLRFLMTELDITEIHCAARERKLSSEGKTRFALDHQYLVGQRFNDDHAGRFARNAVH